MLDHDDLKALLQQRGSRDEIDRSRKKHLRFLESRSVVQDPREGAIQVYVALGSRCMTQYGERHSKEAEG